MALTPYVRALSVFPGGKLDNPARFADEIHADATITIALDHIDVEGADATVWFKAALSTDEETALDAVIAAHNDAPSSTPLPVTVSNQPRAREDGVIYSVPKPSTYGRVMCDRDMKLLTCTLANSVEDLKVNTQTNKEANWNEMSLVNVFKQDGNGDMVACADQADADANGTLSVWDYHAKLPNGTPIAYEIRDGLIYVDPTLPANETFAHRAYAVVAPAIPGNQGGSIIVFDAYLGANPDNLVEALSPQATVLDPSGPAGAAGSTLRLYIFHPAGSKLKHVLRLVTYRDPGTF